MRGIIMLLSVATFAFAGWTVWNDPTIGPQVQALIPMPEGGMPSISASLGGSGSGGGAADGRYGGIGAANRVAGAVTGGN